MRAPILTGAQLAEQAGAQIALAMNNALANSEGQAAAVRIIIAALNDAFNPDEDPIIHAVAGGFSVGIVNILERGLGAIRADNDGDEPC